MNLSMIRKRDSIESHKFHFVHSTYALKIATNSFRTTNVDTNLRPTDAWIVASDSRLFCQVGVPSEATLESNVILVIYSMIYLTFPIQLEFYLECPRQTCHQ